MRMTSNDEDAPPSTLLHDDAVVDCMIAIAIAVQEEDRGYGGKSYCQCCIAWSTDKAEVGKTNPIDAPATPLSMAIWPLLPLGC